jgi:hypothetical protein
MDPYEDPYKITTYEEQELYTILGFDSQQPPSDEDLEDKIIEELKNYRNDRTTSGRKMFQFLKDIYEYFFTTNSIPSTQIPSPAVPNGPTGSSGEQNQNQNQNRKIQPLRQIDLEENDFDNEIVEYNVDHYVNINNNGVITRTSDFHKLGLNNLSQNELEAKLIQDIQKYKSINTTRGRKLFYLYTEIYKRLFDTTSSSHPSQRNDFVYGERDNLMDIANIKLEQRNTPQITQNNIVTRTNSQVVSSNEQGKLNTTMTETEEDQNITYSKQLDYTAGRINPILKETFKRIISVDSQYREETYPNSTDFTLNFTEMLKDVVSMKLYAVQIPITWYTISSTYGSNFFYLKPVETENTYAIYNNPNHEYKVEIAPGNYTPTTLTTEINNKMKALGTIYTDVSFGETGFSYGESDAISKLTMDIQKVYNESSYEMDISGDNVRKMLGFTKTNSISLSSTESIYSYDVSLNNSERNNDTYIVSPNNNTIQIEQYLPSSENGIQPETILNTITITMPLHPVEAKATPAMLLNELNTAFSNNINFTSNTKVEYILDTNTNKYKYRWNIELNRNTTVNQINSKIRIRFPNSNNDPNQNNDNDPNNPSKRLWTGTPSAFGMNTTEIGELSTFTNTITENIGDVFLLNERIIFRPKVDLSGGVYIQETINRDRNNIILQFDGNYNVTKLITDIRNQFANNALLRNSSISETNNNTNKMVTMKISINKIYTTEDYRIVFYDIDSFIKCTNSSKSYRNATPDTTLGYILGFKQLTEYNLSNSNSININSQDYYKNPDTQISTGSKYSMTIEGEYKKKVELSSDSVLNIYLYNYFMIILDDFNQNHLNDGLVTIASQDRSVTLPSYANRKNYRGCEDPITGEITFNTIGSTAGLTQKQIYSVEQIIMEQNKIRNKMSSGPFVKDMFALLPVKTSGAEPGSIYNEFGGTLQQQERVYFGPVNIRRIAIKLINDKGDVVDLNGANWSFQLVCEQLYQK